MQYIQAIIFRRKTKLETFKHNYVISEYQCLIGTYANLYFSIWEIVLCILVGGDGAFCEEDSGYDADRITVLLARRSYHYVAGCVEVLPFILPFH